MTDTVDVDEFLEHFGVLGMHWGVRKDTPTGASRRTDHEAHKDANEFAKAKMFYGEGAGTRRKLINATVNAKSARDPSYKKAFDHHLANQDLAKRAEGARSERHRKDVIATTGKHARSVHRIVTGGMGNVTMAASVIVGAAGVAHATGADRVIVNASKVAYGAVKSGAATAAAKAWLNSKGF